MTVATAAGIAEAQALGFKLLNATLGHVFTSKPQGGYGETAPPLQRWQYSMALLDSAVPAQ